MSNETTADIQADIQDTLDKLNPDGLVAHDDHVLAVPNKPMEITKGGIVVPASARRSDAWYTVISVGFGVERVNLLDRVIFKDCSAIMGNTGAQVLTTESAVFVTKHDGPNPIVAIPKKQIMCRGKRP